MDLELNIDLDDLDLDESTFDLGADLDLDLDFARSEEIDSRIHVRRFQRLSPRLVRYDNAADLAAALPELPDGAGVHALVSGNFIFGDFLEAWLVATNYYAEEMLVVTLSLGKENVDSLKNLMAGGYVGRMALLVSDYWFAHERRKNGGVPYIVDTLCPYDGFSFAAAGTHAKISLIRTSCGRHLVMHGSANLRSSRNMEQFGIDNDRDLYEFHAGWIRPLVERFAVTHKSIRGGCLWQQVTGQTEKENSPTGEKEEPRPAAEAPNAAAEN